jgi:hypothetical protein
MRWDRLAQALLVLAGMAAHVPQPAPEQPSAGGVGFSPIRLVVGVVLGAVVWIASAYGVSRLVGADNFAQSLEEITRGLDSTWWWVGAVAGVVAAIVIAGATRPVAALTAGLTLGAGLLAWQLVWAYVRGFE